jgi:hypothetical protein
MKMGKVFKIARGADVASESEKVVQNVDTTDGGDSFTIVDKIPSSSVTYGGDTGEVKSVKYCVYFRPILTKSACGTGGGNRYINNNNGGFCCNGCIISGSKNFGVEGSDLVTVGGKTTRRQYRNAKIKVCPFNILFEAQTFLK